MANMLLVRFRCKYGLEKPPHVVNLANMLNFLEGRDGRTHDQNFIGTVLYFLDRDRESVTSVDDAFIILHRDKYPTILEHRPLFPY